MEGIDWLTHPSAVVVAGGFGAVWGSFFNVCIARVPRGMSVVRPPSHCFACGTPVRALDNVPLLSYLLLRGRCRKCGARFSPRYLLVELLAAALAAFIFWKFVALAPGLPAGVRLARFAVYFAFAGALLVLSFIDLDTKRLPDVITLPSIPIFLGAGFAVHEASGWERLIGAVAGYLVVRIIADGYYYLTGREGLGLGDGKLLAMMGALLGWKALPFVIFMASFIGIAVAVPVLVAQRRAGAGAAGAGEPADPEGAGEGDAGAPEPAPRLRHVEVPFGPFLSLSALVYLLFGRELRALVSRLVLGDYS